MTTTEYFNRLLPYYRSCFDMDLPYDLCGTECLAHGHFYSHSEKYVLSREARLWESNNFEHVFFLERDALKESDLKEMDRLIREHVEPAMVRGGKSYPEPNHMYTYITFVFLCSSSPEKEVIKSLKKYHYTRNYLFSFRGFCQVRVVAADMETQEIYTNKAGAALRKLFRKSMDQKR
ncbi:MAG: hypothetical protein MR528_08245 [Lachnospiraceae bacterium]|nr:hypothetical protein [Lachnospiraceae bacterium]